MNSLVYIIIVNWNGIEDTIECLESVKQISYSNYKIVLVDNGSKNNQGTKLKRLYPNVIFIQNKINTGFVVANNQGVEIALKNNADHVLLLNNDTVVSKNFLDILVDEIDSSKDIGAVSPKILYYKSNKIWSMGGNISILTGISIMIGKGKDSSLFNKRVEPDFLTGCAFLVKSEVIRKVGMLDPIYFAYYEDVDWSYRIRNAGYKLVVISESIIEHKKSASAGVIGSNKITPFQAYYIARNAIIFARKNLKPLPSLIFVINSIAVRHLYILLHLDSFRTLTSYMVGTYHGLLTECAIYENSR